MIAAVTIAHRWVSFSSRYGIIAAAPAAPFSGLLPARSAEFIYALRGAAVQSIILFFGFSTLARIIVAA
jgi:hypothetical protein